MFVLEVHEINFIEIKVIKIILIVLDHFSWMHVVATYGFNSTRKVQIFVRSDLYLLFDEL